MENANPATLRGTGAVCGGQGQGITRLRQSRRQSGYNSPGGGFVKLSARVTVYSVDILGRCRNPER